MLLGTTDTPDQIMKGFKMSKFLAATLKRLQGTFGCSPSFRRHPPHQIASLTIFASLAVILQTLHIPILNAQSTSRPNIVLILADDLGWKDLSNQGSVYYESPHIDRIAKEGMKFNRGYAACQVCSPSRAAILSGKSPARLKITDWIGAKMGDQWERNTRLLPAYYHRHLPHSDVTMAEAFGAAGYRTFFAGKWHLGGKGSLPQDHGFDVNIGGNHRGSPSGGYFSPYKNSNIENGPPGEQLPLRLGRETADWIEANQDQPFLAFLSFYSVHGPLETTKALWKKYRDKTLQFPQPANRFLIDRTSPVRQIQDNPIYAGMVESMDDAVGIVLQRLETLDLIENTIIIFTSDNGGVSAGDCKATANLPLRGGKGRQWEGGIRVPLYIRLPNGKPGITTTPAIGTDFYPTLLELCGLPMRPNQHVDGVSLAPILLNGNDPKMSNASDTPDSADGLAMQKAVEKLDRRHLFWHYPHYGNQGGEPSSIVSQGQWKLIYYYEDDRGELYNIIDDVGERNDVASQHPGIALSMRSTLQQWLKKTDAELPTGNPKFDLQRWNESQTNVYQSDLPALEHQQAHFLSPDFVPKKGWPEKDKRQPRGN